jgi:hypothetical protein
MRQNLLGAEASQNNGMTPQVFLLVPVDQWKFVHCRDATKRLPFHEGVDPTMPIVLIATEA